MKRSFLDSRHNFQYFFDENIEHPEESDLLNLTPQHIIYLNDMLKRKAQITHEMKEKWEKFMRKRTVI